jgi:hypothetical protein
MYSRTAFAKNLMSAFIDQRQGFAETFTALSVLSYASFDTAGFEPATRKLKCSSGGIR